MFIGFQRQEYWSGQPFPSLGDLPGLGIKPVSPALAGRFFTAEPPGSILLFIRDILGSAITEMVFRVFCLFVHFKLIV